MLTVILIFIYFARTNTLKYASSTLSVRLTTLEILSLLALVQMLVITRFQSTVCCLLCAKLGIVHWQNAIYANCFVRELYVGFSFGRHRLDGGVERREWRVRLIMPCVLPLLCSLIFVCGGFVMKKGCFSICHLQLGDNNIFHSYQRVMMVVTNPQ